MSEMSNEAWHRKYRPQKISGIRAQDIAINALLNYIKNYRKQKKKAILIYGPSGVGKTCSIYAIANELGYEILELNASDFRNKEKINQIVGPALKQRSLFGTEKLILVDEVDGLAGREDFGGIAAITKLVKESPYPIIMTANNLWDQKFSSLRALSEMLEFKSIDHKFLLSCLRNICEKEKVEFDEDAIKSLARRSGGDLRAAINDLQTLSQQKKKIEAIDVDSISDREKIESILNALVKIFKTTDINIAIGALNLVEENIDEAILWIDENLPKEYEDPMALYSAYDKLSKADVFRGRIRRWQHWRFLVYVNALATAGVAVSKEEKNKKFVKYTRTERILKLWKAKMINAKRKAIAAKMAKDLHCSAKDVYKDMPFIKNMFKSKEMAKQISEEFKLEKEEIEWLAK